MPETVKEVRQFIFDNFLFTAEENSLNNDDSFLESGIIDSTGVLEMVNWMEEKFGIQMEDEELLPENLDSVSKVAAFIQKKKGNNT